MPSMPASTSLNCEQRYHRLIPNATRVFPGTGLLNAPHPPPERKSFGGDTPAPQGGGRPLDPRFGRALHSPVPGIQDIPNS